MILLNEPEMVADDPSLALAVGFWRYMTIQTGAPTLHDIAVGTWIPNPYESLDEWKYMSINAIYGAVLSMIDDSAKCDSFEDFKLAGQIWRTAREMADLDFDPEEDVECKTQKKKWPLAYGSNSGYLWFEDDENKAGTCKLTDVRTPYQIFRKGSYK